MDDAHSRIISFEKLCRLCLQEKCILMNIYDSVDDNYNVKIYEKIMACAKITLSRDDGFPMRICVPCLSNLNSAFEFKLQCENADKTLHDIHQILMENSNEKEQKEVYNVVEVQQDKETKVQNLNLNKVIVIKRDDIHADHEENLFISSKVKEEISDFCIMDVPKKNIKLSDNIIDIVKNEQVISNHCLDSVSAQSEKSSEHSFSVDQNNANIPEESKVKKKSNKITTVQKSSCPYCQKMLTRVNEHIRLLHRNKVYICKNQNCGAEFPTLKNLQSHQLKCYNMEKQYKCTRCFKEFYRKCNYKAHVRRHSDRKDFQCQLCEKAFVDSTGLRRHFLKHHEPQQEIFVVGCCGKKFKTKKGLKHHIEKGICGVQVFQSLDSDAVT